MSNEAASGIGGDEDEVIGTDAADLTPPNLENNEETMDSPAKNMKSGKYSHSFEYAPYSMPAAKYGNSPITKNFGTTIDRGFNVNYNEADAGVGSSLTYAAVGSSPAKGWLGNMVKSAKKLGGKILDPLGLTKKAGGWLKDKLGLGGGVGDHTHGPDGAVVAGGGGAEAGGTAEPAGFQAMSKDDYMAMDAAGRQKYMGGLSEADRATQMGAFNA